MTDSTVTGKAGPTDGSGDGGKLGARDLINVGVFTALYLVVLYAIAMIGYVSPWIWVFAQPIAQGAAAIVFVLFLSRVRRFGLVTLMGIIVLLVMSLTGHPLLAFAIGIIPVVAADAIAGIDRRRPLWAALSAGVFSICGFGALAPLLFQKNEYLESIEEHTNSQYADVFGQVMTLPTILIMALATVVLGFIGGYIGTRMRKRHFSRAGIA